MISLSSVIAASSNDIFSPISGNSVNETKNALSGNYFRELLKKVTNTSTSNIESNGMKILSEQEFIAVYCDLQETYNFNTTESCNADKKHRIIVGEIRKLNIKLIRLDNKLDMFMSDMTKLIKNEMQELKDEITILKTKKENK